MKAHVSMTHLSALHQTLKEKQVEKVVTNCNIFGEVSAAITKDATLSYSKFKLVWEVGFGTIVTHLVW